MLPALPTRQTTRVSRRDALRQEKTHIHFMTFEEVLDKFEEDRLMLQREEEDKEMA